jgi:GDP-mannose 6-dehydrogenase
MRISIFGLGYVGAVTAGCLSAQGHEIVGIDVQAQKVDDFRRGVAPIIEPGLNELLEDAHAKGILRATQNCEEAVLNSDVSLVCVGTPSCLNGALDLSYVRDVVQQVAAVLRSHRKHHVLVFRSTMLPGSVNRLVEEFMSDIVADGSLEVIFYPEFLREGTAVADFREPSLTVVGTQTGMEYPPQLQPMFGEGVELVNWREAELIKYACNAFHATKISFANEIGRLGKQLSINSQRVMGLVCQDKRLNTSAYYLRPGNPFGGSCLPKDVRALGHCGRQVGLSLPLLENLLSSNQQHLQSMLTSIQQSGYHEIVILGLSFKSNTDDLRESAMVEVAQNLLGRGYQVRIYDPQLNMTRIVGSNRRAIDTQMPHLASLLHSDLKTAIGQSGLIVAAQPCASITELSKFVTRNHHVLDINGWPELHQLAATYDGFCW